jgi:hypothetical protein
MTKVNVSLTPLTGQIRVNIIKREIIGRTNLVVKYSIVVGNSTVRFCGLTHLIIKW